MIAIHWFRRDLRIEDNTALNHALESKMPVQPIFIFDKNILEDLPADDARVGFIHQTLQKIHDQLASHGSSLKIFIGDPLEIWKQIIAEYEVGAVFLNKDYEPYAIQRDEKIKILLHSHGIRLLTFKDQVIFEETEVVKKDNTAYTVFTPYKRKWQEEFSALPVQTKKRKVWKNFHASANPFPSLKEIGFKQSPIQVRPYDLSMISNYEKTRDLPAEDATSYLSPHLRFGTVSIRQIISQLNPMNEVFLRELIWREFFMQIMFHFPNVVGENFRSKYDGIKWRNKEEEFELWCKGETGYPMVDAGMRQLNHTGFMHNRVRMVTASFLCKNLLIDWRWGEAYFAKKLLDYELSSNNGNWQWAAGTGCDAAPYFRIFNPAEQQKRFDKNMEYIKQWIPEFGTKDYPDPIVDHKLARERALNVYKKGIQNK